MSYDVNLKFSHLINNVYFNSTYSPSIIQFCLALNDGEDIPPDMDNTYIH